MKQPHWYYCDLWRVNIYYFIGWDWNKMCSYVKKKFNEDLDQSIIPIGKALEIPVSKGGQFLIWIKNKKDYESLLHESFHVTNWITSRAGYRLDQYNDESYAYTLTNIFRQGRKAK